MLRRDWIRQHKTLAAAAALGAVLLVVVALGIFWLSWKALVAYINPTDATDRKDTVQVYALIVAGVVATLTAGVGLANLWLTRRNLEQQRELEAQRAEQQRELAQGIALQAYYEQIGKLLTEFDLRATEREDIRELARGQTLTVLSEVDGTGKRSLLTFLQGAGLLRTDKEDKDKSAVMLVDADLTNANLQRADLWHANLRGSILRGANLQGANLRSANLRDANLQDANLQLQDANLMGANLMLADLRGTDLRGAKLQGANLQAAKLQGTIMPDGQILRSEDNPNRPTFEDWRKSKGHG